MNKITLKRIDLWKVLYLYLIFQPSLAEQIVNERLNTIVTYSDEVICVVLVILVLAVNKFELHLLKFERRMLFFIIIFELLGIASGLYYRYQDIQYMLVDAFTCVKFFIFYYGARILTKGKLTDRYFFSLNNICKLLAAVLFLLTMHELFMTPWWPTHDYRYFANSIELFFGHPESLARACMTIILILAYNSRYLKNNIIYMLLLSVVMVLTFRTKAIVAIFAFWLTYIYFVRLGFKNKLPFAIAAIVGGGYMGYDSFTGYYVNFRESIRLRLTEDSVYLANKFFPLGTGFGSYASSMAAQYYSKLYIKLGYLKIWGMGRDSGFLSDTFWPIVIAQTGWFGTAAFALAIIELIMFIIKSAKKDVIFFWIAISYVLYDLISSLAAPAFFYPAAMAPYMLLGMMVSIMEFPKEENDVTASPAAKNTPQGDDRE